MAAKSTLTNMVVCLGSVCLICASILAGVYAVTAEPIEKTNAAILKASVGAVLPEEGEISESKSIEVGGMESEYYECVQNGQTVAYAVKSTTTGFGGPLVVMVGVMADGSVYNTSVLSHSETPGLGAKCNTDEKFMAQWKGFAAGKNLTVTKDGGDVDAITASTITSRAYALAVKNAVEAVKSVAKEDSTNE